MTRMMWLGCWWIVVIILGTPWGVVGREAPFLEKQLKNWTDTFGKEIFNFGNIATKYPEMQNRFQTSPNSEVRKVDLKQTVTEIANDTYNLFKERVDAIRKVMNWAEEKALEYYQTARDPKKKPSANYLNARKLNFNFPADMSLKEREKFQESDPLTRQTLGLKHDSHFGSDVNLSKSVVHIPSSIFDRREDILEGVEWSMGMDKVFASNYQKNPTLLWQYFGSASGFFRQYPAMKWPNDNSNKNYPDIFDCRTRPWYTAASNSPKNMVILQDVSGSMMGLRREISKHVVYTILETLTDNDYVTVLNFTDDTHPVVPCFKDTLVQANLENIREFKVSLGQDKTIGQSNFTLALNTAFDLLTKHRDTSRLDSAHCNEAIMLITDGSPELFEEVFKPRNTEKPGRTRVFTYLIGRDVTDFSDMLGIACSNKGYFTHVTTLGEVQEEVLKYLAVMSRPMVLERQHAISWTPVYADIDEIAESDWLWDEKNKERQKERSQRYKNFLKRVGNDTEGQEFYVVAASDETKPQGKREVKKIAGRRVAEYLDYGITDPTEEKLRQMFAEEERVNRENLAKWGPTGHKRKFQFMISTSMPVFDQRNTTETMEKIAIFLGVVGTDIPIPEIKKIATPFKSGVNGYLFALTENGYTLFHPEWRPLLTDLLKPNYNAVDLSEIELADNDLSQRNLDPQLMEMRKEMINMETWDAAAVKYLDVRVPQDDFKRVRLRRQQYAYVKIPNTTYTLALTVPASLSFGFRGEIELRRDGPKGKNITHLFEGPDDLRRWRVNPDWTYCEIIRANGGNESMKYPKVTEDLLLRFLSKIQNAENSWKWRNTGVGIQSGRNQPPEGKVKGKEIYSCDKELVQSLVFDANVTGLFSFKWIKTLSDSASPFAKIYAQAHYQTIEKFGAVVAFIATRSGLTRWVNYTDTQMHQPFDQSDIRGPEELWYKRAVDRYEIDRQSYVISVPYDAGIRKDSLAIATRAIYVHRNGPDRAAPVAVTGVQFQHEKLAARFLDVASTCEGSGCLNCKSSNLECYVLDDNGYIVITENRRNIGRFVGEVDGALLHELVDIGLYKQVRIVDYQAICFHSITKSAFNFILQNPFLHFKWMIRWFIGRLAWLALQVNLHSYFSPDFSSVLASVVVSANDEQELVEDNPNWHPYLELASINKTRLRPCHNEYNLYTWGPKYYPDFYRKGYLPGRLDNCNGNGHTGFFGVHIINRTNLVMVAVDGRCSPMVRRTSLKPQEVKYEMDEELENLTGNNDVIAQICRTPYIHLERKRPTAKCHYFDIQEGELRKECGGSAGGLPSLKISSIMLSYLVISLVIKFNAESRIF